MVLFFFQSKSNAYSMRAWKIKTSTKEKNTKITYNNQSKLTTIKS